MLDRIAGGLGVPLGELQALDPRVPPVEKEAFRLALSDGRDELERHLAGLEDWRLERLREAAGLLDGAALHELGRRR